MPAERVGLAESTLEKMRVAGDGPTIPRRLGKARIVYDVLELDAWVRSHSHSSSNGCTAKGKVVANG